MVKPWFPRLAGWALALVFAAAAVPKIMHPHDFAEAVFHYRMLPEVLINGTALWVPWLELVLAAALLFAPGWRRAAALLSFLLLVVFTGAIAGAMLRGIDISCGCFSVEPDARHLGAWNLGRNVLLMGLAMAALAKPRRETDRRSDTHQGRFWKGGRA